MPFLLVPFLPVALIYLFSRISGWQTLSQRYPLRGTFPQPKVYLGYGVFHGWLGYNGAIVVSSDRSGLYLRGMPVVISFCHDPIFIPWSEVTQINRRKSLLAQDYRIVTAQAPEVNFALRSRTFAYVREDAQAAEVAGDY
jgi:hypothetical protein